jgi:hypothetical protein
MCPAIETATQKTQSPPEGGLFIQDFKPPFLMRGAVLVQFFGHYGQIGHNGRLIP